jgi:hypothetical protein
MRSTISHEDFVVAYCNADPIDDVVNSTDLKRAQVYSRARYLRGHGVNLPHLTRNVAGYVSPTRASVLNALILKHTEKKV